MKLSLSICRLLIILFSVLLFIPNIAAQKSKINAEKQAVFIYNFFKFVEWSNYNELSSFKVGIIGDEKKIVYDQLVKISKIKTAKELPIEVKRLKDLNQIDDIQLLYFDKSAALKFTDIYTAIGDKHILLVSNGYPYGKSMINFIMDDNKVQYELNEIKCEAAGLKASKVLTMVAIKSEKEWNGLINKLEYLANTDQETVEINTKDLTKLVKEQKRLLNEIGMNTKKLERQNEVLKKQHAVLSDKESEIVDAKKEITKAKKEVVIQKQLVNEQLQKITIQKEKIAFQQENLSSLNNNIYVKQIELTTQQKELQKEAENLIAIQKEYLTIEKALTEKEILVNEQGKTINAQGNEIVTKTSKIEEQKSIIWLSSIFLIIVTILGGLAFRSYRLKIKANNLISKQKEEIEGQHQILEEQHREITDSINYAKRIQDAILPPLKLVRGYMPDSFILYQPKDIIAGDFYWMDGVKNLVIFAAADCTGHGVPGAMVSVVCHNAMNRAVREFKLVEPDEILNKTREIVLETFEKSDEDVRDGMDIALCTINTKLNTLSFSGANNGLYFIRNGEMNQIKPDKQPIGKYDDAKPFTKHVMDLEKGDVIYTFSDGYADQFGGPKGKKFMYKPFRELLLSIHKKPMEDQHSLLMNAFEDWRGNMEQVDDVCVIGVRI